MVRIVMVKGKLHTVNTLTHDAPDDIRITCFHLLEVNLCLTRKINHTFLLAGKHIGNWPWIHPETKPRVWKAG